MAEAEEIKAKALSLLDADKDGKLSFEDAKAMALAMSKGVSESSKAAVLGWLDADGDGTVSGDEARAGAERVWALVSPYKRSLLAGAGFICTFYGRNFKYSILFGRTFAATGWPTVRPAIRELANSWRRGSKAAKAHAPELAAARESLAKLQADVAEGKREKLGVDAVAALSSFRSLEAVFQAIDPNKLLAVLKSAYVGLSASFASVLSSSAAKLGLGLGLGEAIGDAVNSVVAPLVAARLRVLRDRALENEDLRTTLDQLDIDDDDVQRWADAVIRILSTALGVYVAHRVDDVLYLYSACLAGATLAVDNLLAISPAAQRYVSPRLKQLVLAALAASGFVHQKILGRGQIPFLLRIPLIPLSLAESILDKMAINIRATTLAAP